MTGQVYRGLGVSPGLAVAPAWSPRREPAERATAPDGPSRARPSVTADQVAAAFEATAARLEALAARHRRDGAPAYADILEAEAMIARDPTLVDEVVGLLPQPPETAVLDVAARHAAVLEALASSDLRQRGADVREVGRLVADELTGRVRPVPPEGEVVLVDHEVAAPDLLEYADQLLGAVSRRGGPNSHASIVARSLGIPLVVDIPDEALAVPTGSAVLVDGDRGVVDLSPVQLPGRHAATAQAAPTAVSPAVTADGVTVTLLANVASGREARLAVRAGAQGVGLLRTELGFLDATGWPTRAEHEARLRPVLEVLAGLPVTVRLLDFTNDKTPPFLVGRLGASPLDALLQDSAALGAQLQAILSAAGDVRLSIMLPMVTRADQLAAVRERVRLAAAVVGAPRLPRLGAMVELPGAVADVAALAAASDFLSVGTNDLTAATLTLSRTDPRLSPASVADARVLPLVARTVAAARAARVPVSVCGDAAADPVGLPALLGVGIRAISVSASRVAEVRELVHQQSVGRAANGRTVPEPGSGLVSRLVAGGRRG